MCRRASGRARLGPTLAACLPDAANYLRRPLLCPLPCCCRSSPLPAWPASGFFINRSIFSTTSNAGFAMMPALFALSLAVFGYLVYVLLKPEKF